MIDQEVANILEQIRQGVRQDQPVESADNSSASPNLNTSSAIDIEPERVVTLSNQYPGLATMSRAWDRLPPVVSNRTGALASLELWIKGILKRALRWITWEQINFNSAVHHSFMEVAAKQAGYEQELSRLRTRLVSDLESEINLVRADLDLQREQQEILKKQRDVLSSQCQELEAESARARAEIAVLRENLRAVQQAADSQKDIIGEEGRALQNRLKEVLGEIRERDGRLLDEQRVCFKQLSLEASEALLEQDHARREIEERLAKLEAGTRTK